MSVESIRIEGIDTPVSRIGLGTWAIGGWMWGGTDEQQSIDAIKASVDAGISLIDTAPAYGMGLADLRTLREKAVEDRLSDSYPLLQKLLHNLSEEAKTDMQRQGVADGQIETLQKVHLRYEGTDSALIVPYGSIKEITSAFEAAHRQRYGF